MKDIIRKFLLFRFTEAEKEIGDNNCVWFFWICLLIIVWAICGIYTTDLKYFIEAMF